MILLTSIIILILPIICANRTSLCESACVCHYVKNADRDFMTLDVDCSYKLPSLEYSLPSSIHALDLSSNELTRVDKSELYSSTTMEELYLNKNNLIRIDVHAFDMPNLIKLDLSDNNLEFLDPEVFKSTKKLVYLNLASNAFASFALLTFHHLGSLKEIVFDDNNIGQFFQNSNLFQRNGLALNNAINSISLRFVNFGFIPPNFFLDAYDLRKLNIAGNNLTVIPELPFTLEDLDLSNNPITEIVPEDFSELPALKELKLNNLLITEITDYMFASMKSLVKLELERNQNLTEFSRLAFGIEVLEDPDYLALEKLSLKGSRLSGLSKDLLEPFGQLSLLDLQGNPWHCDCTLLWIKRLQITPDYFEHIRCATPRRLYNAKIFELKRKYFSCPMQRRYLGGALAAISFCVLLTTVALWLFFCLPRYQTRCAFVRQAYSPATVYSVLPMNVNDSEYRY